MIHSYLGQCTWNKGTIVKMLANCRQSDDYFVLFHKLGFDFKMGERINIEDVDDNDDGSGTILHQACYFANVAAVKWILTNQVIYSWNINKMDWFGRTAFHRLIDGIVNRKYEKIEQCEKERQIAHWLIGYDIGVDFINKRGETAKSVLNNDTLYQQLIQGARVRQSINQDIASEMLAEVGLDDNLGLEQHFKM